MYFVFKKNPQKPINLGVRTQSSNPLETVKWKLSSTSNHITWPSYIIALLSLSLYCLCAIALLASCNYQQAQIKATKKSPTLCLSLFLSHSFPKSSFSSPDLITASALYLSASQSSSTRFTLSLSLSLSLSVTLSSTMILVQKTQFAEVLGHGYWITLCVLVEICFFKRV